jgi:3-hydroxyisobutyrate dehydrogenase/2-hydroxy-3-oxopropionate reductase
MAKLGFLGLGTMGYPMARNLLRAGHEVALWSNTAEKAQRLAAQENGRFCATPREVAKRADCIFLCVGQGDMSRQVILGSDGIIEGARPGTVVTDASTISPSESRRIGASLKAKGVEFLDAPMTGSLPGAEGGTLVFMIGGDRDVFERVRPYFEPMGKQLYYCGGAGLGLQAKLSQNLILANLMVAFSEGMVLATKGGVDPELMLEILQNTGAKTGLAGYKGPRILHRDFSPNFATKWMHKDVGLMLDSGKELGVPMPITSLAQQLFQWALAKGHGDDDFCSIINVLEEACGIELRAK